jgi:hypothetical protein
LRTVRVVVVKFELVSTKGEIKAGNGIYGIAAQKQALPAILNTRNGSGAFAIFVGVCLNVQFENAGTVWAPLMQ